MTGRDFREFSYSIGGNEEVLFQDAEGNFHQIYTAIRTHTEFGTKVVLQEVGAVVNQWPLKLAKPPKELLDFLNQNYE